MWDPYIMKMDFSTLLLTPCVVARLYEFCLFIKAMLQNKICSDMLLSPPACSPLSRLPELIMPAGQKRSVPVHARFYQIYIQISPFSIHTSYGSSTQCSGSLGSVSFWTSGSGSVSQQRYGSGSFHHQAKIVRKPLISLDKYGIHPYIEKRW